MFNFQEISHSILDSFKNTVIITSFVLTMMLIIEFVNVQTKGSWSKIFKRSKWTQIIFAALLGITPGCLGAYAVVSLYTHNIFNLAALVTAMITTFGDEAFILFSAMPQTALILSLSTLIIAIATGFIIHLFIKHKPQKSIQEFHFEIHDDNVRCCDTKFKSIVKHFKNLSFHRAIILFGLLILFIGLVSGELDHNHTGELLNISNNHVEHVAHKHSELHHEHAAHKEHIDWIKFVFILITSISIIIISIVNDHFLEDHLWGHIIKKHFLKIFLWTFGTLIVINIGLNYLNLENWIQSNQLIILLVAVLVGIIPVSGPHIAFITLFASGNIPFSILLASSVVQDGHGSLPLFAESKKSFVIVKSINILVGLIVGLSGYYLGY